jgi:hypothetical protein
MTIKREYTVKHIAVITEGQLQKICIQTHEHDGMFIFAVGPNHLRLVRDSVDVQEKPCA